MSANFDWAGLEGRAVWIACTVIGITIGAILLHNHIANYTAAANSAAATTAASIASANNPATTPADSLYSTVIGE